MTFFLICNSITLTLFIGLILLILYYAYRSRKNNIFHQIGIPGPERIPFLGDIVNLARKGVYKNDTELVEKYGKIVGIYEGSAPVILLSDLDLLRNVLIKDSHVFVNRRTIKGATGILEHGLTQLTDEHWKNARAIVSPTFSTAKLKTMFNLMNEVSDNYNKRLLEYADKQEIFDIKILNSEFTLDNIATCLFGIQTNSLQNQNLILIKYLKKIFEISSRLILLVIFFISPRLAAYLGKKGYSMLPRDSVNYLTNLINHILNQRRKHLERREDFIQIMVDREEEEKEEINQSNEQQLESSDKHQWKTLKKTLNDKEILGQAVIFMIAGYETTSVLMSFFFYIMATESNIQEKVYQEIRQVFGDDEITYDKIGQLEYLDMVISETFRMYPPILRFDRVASQDYKLGDYIIPKDTCINVPVYSIHHDPQIWSEPEKFIPERFSSAEKATRHPMSYVPFGDGPRNCIGMRFALLEAKLGITKAIRLVKFRTCEKTDIPLQLGKLGILNTTNPILLTVVRRST